jgi:hypothetical protein
MEDSGVPLCSLLRPGHPKLCWQYEQVQNAEPFYLRPVNHVNVSAMEAMIVDDVLALED